MDFTKYLFLQEAILASIKGGSELIRLWNQVAKQKEMRYIGMRKGNLVKGRMNLLLHLEMNENFKG